MGLTHILPLLATIIALFPLTLYGSCNTCGSCAGQHSTCKEGCCSSSEWCDWDTRACCPQGTVTCATGTGCCPCSAGTIAITEPGGYGAVCCAPNQFSSGGNICCNDGTEWCGFQGCCAGTCKWTVENQGSPTCQQTVPGCKAAGGTGQTCLTSSDCDSQGGGYIYCVSGCCNTCDWQTLPMTDPTGIGGTICCLPNQFNLLGICCNQGTELCAGSCCPGDCQETIENAGSPRCVPTIIGCVAFGGTGQFCTTTSDCDLGSSCETGCCVENPPPPVPKIISSPGLSPCPADLDGPYEFPHLIIPINSSQPLSAPGTSFFGQVTGTISSIFNFDIPASDSGKTCTLVFLFPLQSQLTTSSYIFSGSGTLDFARLSGVANASTSLSNAPGVATDYGHTTVGPGNSYTIATFSCPAGSAISFKISAVGDTILDYFQDYNPAPIGLYITKC